MPRYGPPCGADASPRRVPLPRGVGVSNHLGVRRVAYPLRLVPPEHPPGTLRRPPRIARVPLPHPTLTEATAVADALAARGASSAAAIPLGGPTAAERARHLRAAYDASIDDGQRLLLSEIMDHFRAWCEAHELGDPFLNC